MYSNGKAAQHKPSENLPERVQTGKVPNWHLEGTDQPKDLPRDLDEVQEAFVLCHDLWRRSPGGGRWPFASDGPWHLMQGEAGDYVDTAPALVVGKDGTERVVQVPVTRTPRAPLDAREVAQRDRIDSWLRLIPDDMDRRLVWLATRALHKGEGRVPWKAIKGWLGFDRSADALVFRYRKALATVACRLNGWPMNRVARMAA